MSFARWIANVPWLIELNGNAKQISIVWLFHFLGFFLIVGTTTMVSLRVLGLAGRRQTILQLTRQLFPLMWLGVVFAIVTGFVMFSGYAETLYPATVFRIKVSMFIVGIVLGIVVQRNASKWDQLPAVPSGAKVVAAVSMLVWVGLILSSLEVPAYLGI